MKKSILFLFLFVFTFVQAQNMKNCGIVQDFDGNNYNTVLIGKQCWMRENLRTSHFANGDSIYYGEKIGSEAPDLACLYYPNNDYSNVNKCGYLYNWPAVMHGEKSSSSNPSGVQGICPKGWHVPSQAEWSQLVEYVGSQSVYQCNKNKDKMAKSLASVEGWRSNSLECNVGNDTASNNSTGFSALPTGNNEPGVRSRFGENNFFWTCTQSNTYDAWYRTMSYNGYYVDELYGGKYQGRSVRCVRN